MTAALAGIASLGSAGARAAPICIANATNITFGSLGIGALSSATATGTIYEGCTGGWTPNPQVGMSACNAIGAGANSASQTTRTMTNGSSSITYNLYSDSGMSTPYAYPGSDQFHFAYSQTLGGYTTTTTYAQILSTSGALTPGLYTDTYSTNAQAWSSFFTCSSPSCTSVSCGYGGNTGAIPTFTVSVIVLASCSVSAGSLNFGSPSVLTANIDASAALTVACTVLTPYTVALGPGSGTGATTSNRSMTGSGGSISYGLYQDMARSTNWGNTPPPALNADTVSGIGTGSAQSLTVYGRVPPQTTPAQGPYSDTVIVTLTY